MEFLTDGIAEYLIRFRDLLEFLLGVGRGILVWMVFDRLFPVRFLQFGIGSFR